MDTLKYKVCYQIKKDDTWKMPLQRDFCMIEPNIAFDIWLFNNVRFKRFVIKTPEDALNHLMRKINYYKLY